MSIITNNKLYKSIKHMYVEISVSVALHQLINIVEYRVFWVDSLSRYQVRPAKKVRYAGEGR